MDGVDDEFENVQDPKKKKKSNHVFNLMLRIVHTAFDIGVVAYCVNSWVNNN